MFVQLPSIYEIIIATTVVRTKRNEKNKMGKWNKAIGHASSFFEALHRGVSCVGFTMRFRLIVVLHVDMARGTWQTRPRYSYDVWAHRRVDNTQAYFSFFR